MSLGQDGPPTRTRLPETPGGAGTGAPGRRPARSPARSLVTVVGVVVLLIAVIAFANRGGGNGSGTGSGGSGGGSGNAQAQPTAPTGTKPVSAKDTAGIASGFAHTAQGAQSAAANYAVALGSSGMYAQTTRHAIINAIYAPAVAKSQLGTLDKAYTSASFLSRIGLNSDGTAPDGLTFISRTVPVGTKLAQLEGTTATVDVWATSLFGLAGEGSTNPVSESWYTNTFTLQWTGGDWKVTGYQQKDGPAPVARDQAASSAKDMSDAVNEFGGFTYAR